VLCLLLQRGDLPGVIEQEFAGLGEAHAFRQAVHRSHAQAPLELRELLGDRGLAHHQPVRPAADASFLGYRTEYRKVGKVHGITNKYGRDIEYVFASYPSRHVTCTESMKGVP